MFLYDKIQNVFFMVKMFVGIYVAMTVTTICSISTVTLKLKIKDSSFTLLIECDRKL